MGAYPEYTKLMSFSTSSSASGLSSISSRSDLRSPTKGYFDAASAGGSGFGSSTPRGGDARERRSGR
jgi:hypothetical protein